MAKDPVVFEGYHYHFAATINPTTTAVAVRQPESPNTTPHASAPNPRPSEKLHFDTEVP